MKNWIALLFLGVLTFSACISDDDFGTNIGETTYDPPLWQENIAFVSTDTSVAAQIDLFVAANNLTVVTSASGLVYVIQEPGSAEKPTSTSSVVAWYKGYTVDGVIFDQSGSTPFASSLNRLIQGWQEGIPLLGKDGKMWMFLPPSLAYGNNRPSDGDKVLVFEIELADFQ